MMQIMARKTQAQEIRAFQVADETTMTDEPNQDSLDNPSLGKD